MFKSYLLNSSTPLMNDCGQYVSSHVLRRTKIVFHMLWWRHPLMFDLCLQGVAWYPWTTSAWRASLLARQERSWRAALRKCSSSSLSLKVLHVLHINSRARVVIWCSLSQHCLSNYSTNAHILTRCKMVTRIIEIFVSFLSFTVWIEMPFHL